MVVGVLLLRHFSLSPPVTARSCALLCLVSLLSACAHEPSAPPAELGGTQWRFPAERAVPFADPGGNTVTFLADGTVRFSGLPPGAATGGHWTRDGNTVVFDANEFTEFRVVLEGNHMAGQWKRLEGEDQGQPHATSLERVEAPGR